MSGNSKTRRTKKRKGLAAERKEAKLIQAEEERKGISIVKKEFEKYLAEMGKSNYERKLTEARGETPEHLRNAGYISPQTGTANINFVITTGNTTATTNRQDGFYTNNYESWEVRNGKIIK